MCIPPAVQIYKNITFLFLHTHAPFCEKKETDSEHKEHHLQLQTLNNNTTWNKIQKPNPTKLQTMDKLFMDSIAVEHFNFLSSMKNGDGYVTAISG